MKKRQIISIGLAALMLAAAVSGCGGNKEQDGKINISVGLWPDETQGDSLAKQSKIK